jgi:WS/DGAT/MGAT family acyltransferase
MSELEAMMWHLERDPRLASTFANVTFLDREPDIGRLKARLAAALPGVPRLRQRVVAPLGRLTPPLWVDAEVDLEHHVTEVTLARPGSDRQLLDLAVRIAGERLDTSRPLWRFVLVHGLSGGRAGIVQHIHHAVTDGEGGVRFSLSFIDFEREPDAEASAAEEPAATPATADEPTPSSVAAVADVIGHTVRRGLGIAQRSLVESVGLAARPDRLPAAVGGFVTAVRSLAKQAFVVDRARSPIWRERSDDDHALEVLRVPLDDARRAAKDLGGSLNDLLVTAVAGGVLRYHEARGVDLPAARMAMPVSTREKGSSTSNAFGMTRALLPLDPDPAVRFTAIRDRLASVRTPAGVKLMSGAAGLAGLLPFSVLSQLARAQTATIDFTTSNVRGAPVEMFIAGARIEANYPVGPLAGTAMNCTLLSSGGWLDMGVHIDATAVDDPAALRDDIEAAWAELLALG